MGRHLHVLIVEDCEPDAVLLVRELERDFEIVVYERVQTHDAMRSALEARRWDLVLSDYSLPSFSAPEALTLLHEVGVDLPFIIVSGKVDEETAVLSMRAGAHDFIVKDRLARLRPAIQRELREARARNDRLREKTRADVEREELLLELREAVQARDAFLAIASHELKTPLTSLQLVAERLRKAERDGSIVNMPADWLSTRFDLLVRQTTRLGFLVKSLLDVARIRSNRMLLTRESVDLSDVVREVIEQFDVLARHSGSELIVDLSTAIGSWDPARLETVVANLISNALKFGHRNPIEVSVTCDGATARLVVTDHGIGIAEKERARIFEKFERAVPESHYGGLGLGLWTAREIIDAHGGRLTVTSEPGLGSTFIAELPIHDPEGGAP